MLTKPHPPASLEAAWQTLSNPRSIALVGASGRPNPLSFTMRLLESNERLGYAGRIFLINPNRNPIAGREVWASLADLPEPPDVVALNLPYDKVLDAARAAIDGGARALVIHAGGFGERGEEGAARQAELLRLCTDAGVLAIGPNCLGYMSPISRVSVSSLTVISPPGPVAIISQSGSAASYIQRMAGRFGASFVFSTGNEAVTTAEDLMLHLIDDPSTKVIAMFIEALRKPEALFPLAERAHAAGKPIIALKAGLTAQGGQVSWGHTGALAGSGQVYRQAFDQAGVILAEDFDELGQTIELITAVKRSPGRGRMGVLATSGGELGTFTDLAIANGVALPPLAQATLTRIQTLLNLPPDVFPRNPVDVGIGFNSAETYRNQMKGCIEAVADDDGVDMIAVLQSFERAAGDLAMSHTHQMIGATIEAAAITDKPVMLISNLTCVADADMLADARAAGLPALNGGREALRAIGHLNRYAERREAWRRAQAAGAVRKAIRPVDGAEIGAGGNVSQAALFPLLERHGVAVTPMRRVASAEAARQAAADFGGTVVMKIDTDRVTHKSDIGGVALGVTPETAAEAFARLTACVDPPIGAFAGEGVVVGRQLEPGAEFYIGAKRDETFGAVVVCGLGGVLLELLGKTAIVIAPFDRAQALDAIARSGALPLLNGFRGGVVADLDGLADLMVAVGDFALALGPDLEELDLNPVIINAQHPTGCAVDARLLLKEA